MIASEPHVGTLRERPLHAALKAWYAGEGDGIEVPVDGFVIDIVRDDLLIEIQTRSFSSLKRKLTVLLEDHPVRLVHPIAVEKWIVKPDPGGAKTSRRRSPRKGSPHDLFSELVSFPHLVAHPNLTIDLALIQAEEEWRFDGSRGWRRKGWVVEERRLLGVLDVVSIDSPTELLGIIPPDLPAEFTTADLAVTMRCTRRLAQQAAYCLRQAGCIEMVDKQGNAIVYAVAG
jgi:hypothetical protein